MKFQAFARFNGGFRFSSRPPRGRMIYEALRDGQGDTYDRSWDARQQKRLFAAAMAIACAQYQNDRAAANANPLTATELLPQIEADYQIIAPHGATLHERRQVADARRQVTRGPRRESVEDALRTLLGDDFIELRTTAVADRNPWPTSPGDVGVFSSPGTPKKAFRLTGSVIHVGIPVTVGIEVLGTDAPMPGEAFTLDPDTRHPHIEKVTLTAGSATSITATFGKPHAAGAIAVRPHPVWISNQRYSRIVLTVTAARDQETRRKVNELMARMLRGISRWCVVSNEGTFRLAHATRAKLDSTVLV
jgi:hypothetical protein